jgi:hypothetical protein
VDPRSREYRQVIDRMDAGRRMATTLLSVCSATRSESPWPRLSKTIRRAKDVSLFSRYWLTGNSQ